MCSLKDTKYHKTQTHFLLQILASVARCEPFGMILVIFVTKNAVYSVPEFPTLSLNITVVRAAVTLSGVLFLQFC